MKQEHDRNRTMGQVQNSRLYIRHRSSSMVETRTDHCRAPVAQFHIQLYCLLFYCACNLCLLTATYCTHSPVCCCKTFVVYYQNQTQICQIRVRAWTQKETVVQLSQNEAGFTSECRHKLSGAKSMQWLSQAARHPFSGDLPGLLA